MFKLGLEKTEEPEIKLPTSAGSSKKQETYRKTSTFALLTTPKPLCGHQTGKILKEMRIPDHLTCLLRNLYAGQEATVKTGHEQQTGSKSGKVYIKAVYCNPVYLLICREHYAKCWAGGTQAEIKISGRNINNLRYADDITLMAESEVEL